MTIGGLAAAAIAAALLYSTPFLPALADEGFKVPDSDNPFSEGRLARGSRNIKAAWFSDPVRVYGHTALGRMEEPRTLVVSTDKRVVFRLTLPEDSVFEDREPRIVDIDGDGLDEIVVIRSYSTKGAVLAIAAVRDTLGLAIVAETEPSGVPFEWINPAGFGDFDGDGRPDIALVRRPHDLGVLEIYSLKGTQFEKIMQLDDVSNHRKGLADTHLWLVRDFDGDGVLDIAIPTFDRHILQILSLKGRQVREIDRHYLHAKASENFSFVMRRGQEMMAIGIGGGRKQYIPVR